MKKLIALVMVLGLATTASAALQIVAPKSVIDIGETVLVDIVTDTDLGVFQQSAWALVGETEFVSLAGGNGTAGRYGAGWASNVTGQTTAYDAVIPPAGSEGVWGNFLNGNFSPVPAGSVIAEGIELTGVAMGVASLRLYFPPDNAPMVDLLGDPLAITVVPEPITFGLLGLGGLFLRRRRA